jgi:DNA repair photolyase
VEQKRRARYYELACRTILNRCSKPSMPFVWTINPYRGCEFACRYCYARGTHEFMGMPDGRDFEEKIYAKGNVAVLLRHELRKAKLADPIAIGTATDPYQPAERRFGRTRAVLQVFEGERGRHLSVTTKSDLIVRDLELLRAIARANVLHVNITLTTLDESLARLLEPLAPRPALRLAAIEALSGAGISVGVFPNPILPWITDTEANLDAVAGEAARAGARYFGGGVLYLTATPREFYFDFLERHYPALLPGYQRLFRHGPYLKGPYVEEVRQRVAAARARHGLASSPIDYRPEAWEGEEQMALFDIRPAPRAAPDCVYGG